MRRAPGARSARLPLIHALRGGQPPHLARSLSSHEDPAVADARLGAGIANCVIRVEHAAGSCRTRRGVHFQNFDTQRMPGRQPLARGPGASRSRRTWMLYPRILRSRSLGGSVGPHPGPRTRCRKHPDMHAHVCVRESTCVHEGPCHEQTLRQEGRRCRGRAAGRPKSGFGNGLRGSGQAGNLFRTGKKSAPELIHGPMQLVVPRQFSCRHEPRHCRRACIHLPVIRPAAAADFRLPRC